MKYSLIAAVLVAFALSACGDPKPGQYPPGFMDEREGMDELDDALEETAEQEKTVMDTVEEKAEGTIEAVEETAEQEKTVMDTVEEKAEGAIEAVEETVEEAIEAVEEAFDNGEAKDDNADEEAKE